MVHIADNVKNNVSYICHCCGCCCGQLRAINSSGIRHAVHTSNFLAAVDTSMCKGCARCVKACPVMAIAVKPRSFGKAAAEIDEELCLGCGVCNVACKNKALSMKHRPKRVFTPEHSMERLVRAAVERGTVHHMLFDDPDSVTSRGMNLALGALLSLAPAKRLLAVEQIRSTFVKAILKGARRQSAQDRARNEAEAVAKPAPEPSLAASPSESGGPHPDEAVARLVTRRPATSYVGAASARDKRLGSPGTCT